MLGSNSVMLKVRAVPRRSMDSSPSSSTCARWRFSSKRDRSGLRFVERVPLGTFSRRYDRFQRELRWRDQQILSNGFVNFCVHLFAILLFLFLRNNNDFPFSLFFPITGTSSTFLSVDYEWALARAFVAVSNGPVLSPRFRF